MNKNIGSRASTTSFRGCSWHPSDSKSQSHRSWWGSSRAGKGIVSHHEETRELPGERDNARNNARCTQARKTTQTSFDRSRILLAKTAKSRYVPLFGGLRDNVHGSSMARWKARGRLPVPISVNWTVSPALTVEALWADIGQNRGVRKGGGSLWA